jgi:eukaryotic-like serine/threonine-protein kinase
MASTEKKYTISIPVDTFWKVVVPSLFAAALLGVVFIDLIVMPGVVGIDRDMKVVPSVAGLSLDQGREKLFATGLLTEIRSREYDKTVPDGNILGQTPGPGEKVKKGRRILVTVSKGKEFTLIPNVKKMTERQARIELKKNGITIGDVKKSFNNENPADAVIDAFPASGTTISRDMKVDLFISKGTKTTSAEMPNIVGESLNEAQKKIEESGLTVGKIGYKNDPSLLPGTVVAQSIYPGENVPLSTSVDMTVSVIQ